MNKRLLSISLVAIIILIVAGLVIAYGRGYRPDFRGGKLATTGLLVATSYPNAAQVFIDAKLTTATDNTINLLPGFYDVKIVKDGYFPWQKRLKIQGEIVTKTEALLISTAPSFRALTNAGVLNPLLSPDGNRLVYGSATGSAEKRGVYVIDFNDRPILGANNRQLSQDSYYLNLSEANFLWSPDGKQILAYFKRQTENNSESDINFEIENVYLLATDKFNEVPEDVTLTYDTILADWEKAFQLNEKQRINSLKGKTLRTFVNSWQILGWTINETKILYTATESAQLPLFIKPALIGTNSQPEDRNLVPGKIYVYDSKEDKNFYIGEIKDLLPKYPLPSLILYPHLLTGQYSVQWLTDNQHLILNKKENIIITEYDGFNKTTVYAGPFVDNYVFPWPDFSRLVILANYNPSAGQEPNLYSLTLR